MNNLSDNVKSFFDDLKYQQEQEKALAELEAIQLVNTFNDPWVIPDINSDVTTNSLDIIFGFLNGAIDVFPYKSNPNRCRNNIT